MKLKTLLEANPYNDREFRQNSIDVLTNLIRSTENMNTRRFRNEITLDNAIDAEYQLMSPWDFSADFITGKRFSRDDGDFNLYAFRLFIVPVRGNGGGGVFTRDMGAAVIELELGIKHANDIVRKAGYDVFIDPDEARERIPDERDIDLFSDLYPLELDYRNITIAFLSLREIVKVFVHEHIHFQDDMRSDNYVSKPKPGVQSFFDVDSDDNSPYYNNALEMNAHFQEALQEFDRAWKQMSADKQASILSSFDAFKDYIVRAHFEEDWYSNLTPKNSRKVDKRLAQTYQMYRDEF